MKEGNGGLISSADRKAFAEVSGKLHSDVRIKIAKRADTRTGEVNVSAGLEFNATEELADHVFWSHGAPLQQQYFRPEPRSWCGTNRPAPSLIS